jgi:hypothetical protein
MPPRISRLLFLIPWGLSACVSAVDYRAADRQGPSAEQRPAAELSSIPPEVAARLRDRDAVEAYRKYLAASEHRAFATSGAAWGWVFNRASPATAVEDALAECGKYRRGHHPPCEIVSVDGLEPAAVR